jgi:parallel beta-helix repeat protein
MMIDGDLDFKNQANTSDWGGNGTEFNPFIITDLNITSQSSIVHLVNISHTRVFFILEANLFVGGSNGLRFTNVSNCIIRKNTIREASNNGIYFILVDSSTIEQNTIHENSGSGIMMDYSTDNTVARNIIYMNDNRGIHLRDASENLIFGNNVGQNSGAGINLANSDFCTIEQNIVDRNVGRGLAIEVSEPTLVINNTVYDNGDEGALFVVSTIGCNVTQNTFYRNGLWGIRIDDGWIHASHNNIIYNGQNLDDPGQISDTTSLSVFSHNYWSDWVAPDSNNDDIVDLPYPYGEDKSKVDDYPHVYAFSDFSIRIFTNPVLVSPNETIHEQFYFGPMDISWGPSSDTFGFPITYSVFYTIDSGTTWTPISSNITQTTISWNTSSMLQNESYSIKVEAYSSIGFTTADLLDASFVIREHTLTAPEITYPLGGEFFTGGIDVLWNAAIDSWEHEITYLVYVSYDGGLSWILTYETIGPGCSIRFRNETLSFCLIKVIATDLHGLSSEDILDVEVTVIDDAILPWVYVPVFLVVLILGARWWRKRRRIAE